MTGNDSSGFVTDVTTLFAVFGCLTSASLPPSLGVVTGKHVSSGCIRMLNDDVIDLYARVNVGTKVIVLPDEPHRALDASAAHRQRQASLY